MAIFSAACEVELQRGHPGMTREELDRILATSTEDPAEYRAEGYPCIAAYFEALIAERAPRSYGGAGLVVGGLALVLLLAVSSGGARGGTRGLRGARSWRRRKRARR